MSRFPEIAALALAASLLAGIATAGQYGLGREATKEEVAAWNTDIRPDGQGLPEGKGTVTQGEEIYSEKCADCHGAFGEGTNRWTVLAGGEGTLTSDNPVRSIGSYWPYLSTVFDYINRAMPTSEARSLSPNEVYAITAYLLYLNDIVTDEDFELSKANFTTVQLPNEKNFIPDDRLKSPVFKKTDPCMKNCKSEVKITGRAGTFNVTPDKTGD